MKIIVLNGSPKGDMSVTLQYVHFIRKKFPQHEWKIFNVAQQIRGMEAEEKAFGEVMEEIRKGALLALVGYSILSSTF